MEDFDAALERLIDKYDADYYLFSATIDDVNADKFIMMLRENKKKRENCVLILTTYGGDPDAGYRILRSLHRYYKNIIFNVFGSCKSTGTLMALGADEIVMSDFGEFGPLDIQLMRDDELSNTSGLNIVQSLMSLNEQLFRFFEENFMGLKRKSRGSITTRTAAEISSKLSVGLISPISAQIDPVKLGEIQRAIKIAEKYGTRLLREHSREVISKLIVGYPSHGFVIDFGEAKDLFSNVRWVEDDECILEEHLLHIVRNETDTDIIFQLETEKIREEYIKFVEENLENKVDETTNEENVINKENNVTSENSENSKLDKRKKPIKTTIKTTDTASNNLKLNQNGIFKSKN